MDGPTISFFAYIISEKLIIDILRYKNTMERRLNG